MAEETVEREKLPELDLEKLKKTYETKEMTNKKGQKRLWIVLKELEVPVDLKGRRVFVFSDKEEDKHYLVHSVNLGIDPVVKAALTKKREAARIKLNSDKDAVKLKIKALVDKQKAFIKKQDFSSAEALKEQITVMKKELSDMPHTVKFSDITD